MSLGRLIGQILWWCFIGWCGFWLLNGLLAQPGEMLALGAVCVLTLVGFILAVPHAKDCKK